MNNLTG